jgi:DNA replication protein DnaC
MLTELITTHFHHLKLSGMAQAFSEQQEQPPTQDLSFNERLALLTDREMLHRNNRRISHLLRQAKLRQQACIETIDYKHRRELNKSQFTALLGGDFIRQKHNLIITGLTGCGKSYLACALGNQACRMGFSVQYLCVPRFLEELNMAHADGSYGKVLVQLAKRDLIILDDFGMAPALTSQQHRDLFNLIDDRHQLKSTLITSQLPVKNWHDYIGEPTAADAILDRLLQNAHRIELKGESMRKTKSIATA